MEDDNIIVPPPDIRVIADKTADFVARNGPDFEARIMATSQENAKFRFLSQNDTFRPYYDMRVLVIKASVAGERKLVHFFLSFPLCSFAQC